MANSRGILTSLSMDRYSKFVLDESTTTSCSHYWRLPARNTVPIGTIDELNGECWRKSQDMEKTQTEG